MNGSMQPQEARAILEWYLAAGVDLCVENAPVNRMTPEATQPAPPAQRNTSIAPTIASPATATSHASAAASRLIATPSAGMAKARELADQAQTLEALRAAVLDFDGCALKKTAAKTVFADGNPNAGVMLIGEAPGAEEDRQGIPFCGPSGKLLNAMFASIGLNRQESLYISNSVFWRPPGNRTPSPEEIAICRPLVEKHIALVNPKALVLLGASAIRAVLEMEAGITRMRGKTYQYNTPYLAAPITTFVTFHPSFLLRQPAQKRLAWHDLLAIEDFLGTKK